MGIVEIRCPRCGAQCNPLGKTRGEYRCDHCGAVFHLIDPARTTVTHDTRTHNCPYCGRPVRAEEGYMCMECGKEDVCSNCVKRVRDKFICNECLKQKWLIIGPSERCPRCNNALLYIQRYGRWYCNKCNQYVKHLCPICGESATYRTKLGTGYCTNCKTDLTYQCPTCRGPLSYVPEYRRWYCYRCRKYA